MPANPPSSQDDGAERPLLATARGASPADYGSSAVSDAQAGVDVTSPPSFSRNLGALEAFAIVISIVIGSGVFTSPGAIDTNVPSPGLALVIWVVGGVLAWTGASTLAELGTAIPGEGGVQPYLQYIFGEAFGFLAAWTWVVAVMPATLAILSIVFVESIYSAAGVTDRAGDLSHKLLSVLTLVIISVANCVGTRTTTRLNGFFVAAKFTAIAAVVAAGVAVVAVHLARGGGHDDQGRREVGGRDWFSRPWFAYRTTKAPDGSETDWTQLGGWAILGHLSAALYGALWAYSGWDKAIYISAELSAPARQLPLAINTALPVIILCFLAANTAYYILLPWDVVSTTDSVAVTAITRLLGPAFGILAAVLICLVVAGSLLGNSFVAGRMAVAAAHKKWLPVAFSRVGHIGPRKEEQPPSPSTTPPADPALGAAAPESSVGGTDAAPINAILLAAALSALYILFGSFRALLTFNGLGEYSFFFLAVLGALVLRVREPDLQRPYRPPVVVPTVFALVSGFVVVRGALFAPLQAVVLVFVWGLGLLFYFTRKRLAAGPTLVSSGDGDRT
ncbi:hypothetical protein VTK73DRAFT_4440 [Phialemonium thermophilum]|uniref:Amino acid transporter n=1 Tax=Phialemonium thermophilum TaxID=223376 RepID=A0ABR3WTG5_9PEZI